MMPARGCSLQHQRGGGAHMVKECERVILAQTIGTLYQPYDSTDRRQLKRGMIWQYRNPRRQVDTREACRKLPCRGGHGGLQSGFVSFSGLCVKEIRNNLVKQCTAVLYTDTRYMLSQDMNKEDGRRYYVGHCSPYHRQPWSNTARLE